MDRWVDEEWMNEWMDGREASCPEEKVREKSCGRGRAAAADDDDDVKDDDDDDDGRKEAAEDSVLNC